MEFEKDMMKGKLFVSKDKRYCLIQGYIKERVKNRQVTYIAASPVHYNGSFSGSGLPFPNQYIAFENTPNSDIIKLNNENYFEILIKMPNSYYSQLGSVLIPSRIHFEYNNDFVNKKLYIDLYSIPYRTLTYDSRNKDVMFYNNIWNLPVRTQEQILRDSGYTFETTKDFWNLKPSL